LIEKGSSLRKLQRLEKFLHNLRKYNTEKVMGKVMVSGCFDMLHSGHVAFLKSAAEYGEVVVCAGSDETVFALKGRYPVIPENERKYMLQAVRWVTEVRISRGSGHLDFVPELRDIRPEIFIVNADGDSQEKRELMKSLGIDYLVLDRIPENNLIARSTTDLRRECNIPYRLDLAGGWLDQPFVSKEHAGSVVTISIEPTAVFNNRSGMASSTRKAAQVLWKYDLPLGDRELLAKQLFCFENPPGTKEIAGSQDAIGLVLPGLNKLHYSGDYWPESIESQHDETILEFLEKHIHLIPLGEREDGYAVLSDVKVSPAGAGALAEAADLLYAAACERNALRFGQAMTRSFEAQIAMFPNMLTPNLKEAIKQLPNVALGYKVSGAGGGGYLVAFTEKPIPNALTIKIRRKSSGF
jgi:cytidyltransferase-like protein